MVAESATRHRKSYESTDALLHPSRIPEIRRRSIGRSQYSINQSLDLEITLYLSCGYH